MKSPTQHTEASARIWSTPLEELARHEVETKLGLYQSQLQRLRQDAARLEQQARSLRAEEAATRQCITRARQQLGLEDSPIPDFSREEQAHG